MFFILRKKAELSGQAGNTQGFEWWTLPEDLPTVLLECQLFHGATGIGPPQPGQRTEFGGLTSC